MTNFDRVIKKLVRLGRDRPDPEDHLYNVTQCLEGIELSEEEECNFYRYITCQNTEDFEYLPRSEIVTLGDLGDEELERIQKSIGFGENEDVECFQNGMETTMIVKNVTNTNIKDNGKKFLDGPRRIVQSSPQGGKFESCPPGSLEDIQEISSRSSSEDEKEG